MLDVAGPAYRVSINEARRTLPDLSLPGRFERVGKFILDVAHNPDGIRALVASLDAIALQRPVAAVLGVLGDKDWKQMMSLICPAVDCTVLTAPASAPPNRAWDPERALEFGRSNGWQVQLVRDLPAAVAHASAIGSTVVITGSFHTVGEASLLGLQALHP